MQHEILARPAASAAKLTLQAGESVTCEVGAMIAMSSGFNVETTSRSKGGAGGLVKGLKRMFAGENLFLNHFTATQANQTLIIGPGLLGDVIHYPMRGGTLVVQGSSWLASATDIDIDATWQGIGKALFSGEGMFWVKCSGAGSLIFHLPGK